MQLPINALHIFVIACSLIYDITFGKCSQCTEPDLLVIYLFIIGLAKIAVAVITGRHSPVSIACYADPSIS